jgi:hypothetical protein
LKQPIKIQEKVIKEIEDKENDDLGEGDDAKEDGVIEDSKMEISSDPKSPNNSRNSLLLIFDALPYQYFLYLFYRWQKKTKRI